MKKTQRYLKEKKKEMSCENTYHNNNNDNSSKTRRKTRLIGKQKTELKKKKEREIVRIQRIKERNGAATLRQGKVFYSRLHKLLSQGKSLEQLNTKEKKNLQ